MPEVGIQNQMKSSITHSDARQIFINEWGADKDIVSKKGFIRKVSCLLSLQLVLASIIVSSTLFTPIMRFYINENGWLLNVGYLSCIVSIFTLMAKRTKSPTNWIFLMLFTCSGIYTVAVVVTYYDQLSVLQAFILASCSTIIIVIYSSLGKCDFSPFYAGLFSCIAIVLFSGFFQMMLGSTRSEMLIAAVGSIVFSLYIIYGISKLMHKLSPHEYVVGVIDLYLGVINVIISILQSIFPCQKYFLKFSSKIETRYKEIQGTN